MVTEAVERRWSSTAGSRRWSTPTTRRPSASRPGRGLRREGVLRGVPPRGRQPSTGSSTRGWPTTPRWSEPEGFRALLNSFLPRKRAISQMLIRDLDDRVLLCQLTYKQDWDLPGGVVEVGESPQLAVVPRGRGGARAQGRAGRLLLTDWLPPWGGWDDAVCLVFDGGVHDPAIVERIVRRSGRSARPSSSRPSEVAERAPTSPPAGSPRRWRTSTARPAYTESGG